MASLHRPVRLSRFPPVTLSSLGAEAQPDTNQAIASALIINFIAVLLRANPGLDCHHLAPAPQECFCLQASLPPVPLDARDLVGPAPPHPPRQLLTIFLPFATTGSESIVAVSTGSICSTARSFRSIALVRVSVSSMVVGTWHSNLRAIRRPHGLTNFSSLDKTSFEARRKLG